MAVMTNPIEVADPAMGQSNPGAMTKCCIAFSPCRSSGPLANNYQSKSLIAFFTGDSRQFIDVVAPCEIETRVKSPLLSMQAAAFCGEARLVRSFELRSCARVCGGS
jgi:hypothetical protein